METVQPPPHYHKHSTRLSYRITPCRIGASTLPKLISCSIDLPPRILEGKEMFPPLFTDPSLSLSLHFSTLFALSHLSHDNVVSSSFRRIYVDILYLVCTYLDKFGEIASCAKLASKTRYGGGARLLSYSPKKRVSPPLNGTVSFAEHHHRQNSFFVQFHSSTPLPKRG